MNYIINSTGQCIIADLEFVQQHHSGDFTLQQEVTPPASRYRTQLEFRRLFTRAERESSDELEVTFETNQTLSTSQKRALRSGYKDLSVASSVNLDDPSVLTMLNLYEALGVIAAGRAAEILA